MAKNKIRVTDYTENLRKKFVLLSNFMDLNGEKSIANDLLVLANEHRLTKPDNKELAHQILQMVLDMKNNLIVEESSLELKYGISLRRSCKEPEEEIIKKVGQSILNTYDTICENLDFLDDLGSLIKLAGITFDE